MKFLRGEDGQGLVEYGLILVLVSVIAIAALTTMGTEVSGLLNTVGTTLSGITTGS